MLAIRAGKDTYRPTTVNDLTVLMTRKRRTMPSVTLAKVNFPVHPVVANSEKFTFTKVKHNTKQKALFLFLVM